MSVDQQQHRLTMLNSGCHQMTSQISCRIAIGGMHKSWMSEVAQHDDDDKKDKLL